jgi:hypothetical protein
MRIAVRRIIVLTVAVAIVLISLAPYLGLRFLYRPFLALWDGGMALLGTAQRLIPEGAPGQNLNTSERDLFSSLSVVGLAVATALSVFLFFWNPRIKSKAITFVYFLFLSVLLCMSTANFAALDLLLNRRAQALIDLVLVVLGLITISILIRIEPQLSSQAIVRAVVIFLIALQGIALPAIYGLLWFLNWQNAITLSQSRNLNLASWISAIAAASSAAIAVLSYRSSKHKTPEKDDGSRIVIP